MAIGTFLYPAITEKLSGVADSVKASGNNTFTGNNTFNGTTTLTNTITFKNPSNNNGAFIQNFDYNSENYTALKFVKNNTTAMLILEVNYNRNTATISSPNSTNGLHINNLATPTEANQATNKGYVDGLLSKDISQEQLAPFKLGNTPVYMKYVNDAITVPNTADVTVPIPGLPNIVKLISHSLTVDNQYMLPWNEGSVNLRLVIQNNILKIKANNGSWVNRITGMVYYTKA